MQKKRKIKLYGYHCNKCGAEWVPRKREYPKVCPKCHVTTWDKPKRIRA